MEIIEKESNQENPKLGRNNNGYDIVYYATQLSG
jgi:hypothetical protein